MKIRLFSACVALCLITSLAPAAPTIQWAGMRGPCKVSNEDGLNTKNLGKKIGRFLALDDAKEWETAIKSVSGKFAGSKPWVTWGMGALKDAQSLSTETNEAILSAFDKNGVSVFLEIWPTKKDDVPALIDIYLGKFKGHSSIVGFSVDLEYYKKVDDAAAKAWDEKIKGYNPQYRLMMKHWEEAYMPPTYRGKGDMIFVNNSSEEKVETLNEGFATWAEHFAPSAVGFMIGYPADEDGMDGNPTGGWAALKDPIKDWGDALTAKLKKDDQEIGIIWVCAKSGKTFNSGWDLTKGNATPGAR